MIIYALQNRLNGKTYVGKTTRSLSVRVAEHRRTPCPIGRALRKWGREQFDIIVLEHCDSETALCEAECRWIAELNTVKTGYNCTAGGDGICGYRHTDDAKYRMSLKRRGSLNANWGKFGSAHPKYGYVMCEASRRRLSESLKGRPGIWNRRDVREKIARSRWKRITKLDDDGNVLATYESVKAAAKANNCFAQGIARCARGGRKHAAGFIWRYV